MSLKVVILVCSRIIGSPALKAILVNMADKASDGGEGVFASKATIAAETEFGIFPFRRAVMELVERGQVIKADQLAYRYLAEAPTQTGAWTGKTNIAPQAPDFGPQTACSAIFGDGLRNGSAPPWRGWNAEQCGSRTLPPMTGA